VLVWTHKESALAQDQSTKLKRNQETPHGVWFLLFFVDFGVELIHCVESTGVSQEAAIFLLRGRGRGACVPG
jgi:hypothetical protein